MEGMSQNINKNDTGDVTSANDDEHGIKAHKNVNRIEIDINTYGTGNVISVNDECEYEMPRRNPTKSEERIMLGKSIELMIVSGMTNHVYRFENKIRIQSTGGPIGLSLTGEVADCFMIDWDRRVLDELKNVNSEPLIYSRFKDDILVVTKSLEKGTKYRSTEASSDY
jgi:hypothetical protein